MNIDRKTIASMIDHTLLKATATPEQIVQCCNQAKQYNFASVCANPCFVKLMSEELKGSGVKVCTVIGFPLGANSAEVKAFEAAKAVEDGADEIDMVINVGEIKAGNLKYVENEIKEVVRASQNAVVKVIIETCFLDDNEKVIACKLAQNAGAGFVKTSTGFGTGGAKAEDVRLMRQTVGNSMGVKASGGIRSLDDVLKMIEAGANRIGTSSGIAIIEGIGDTP
ncbi:MAG TPA: deoxyribose-phosphate aldolase [Clostridiaceae bacterium]|nr:deoxyribose-phosphate aldolase [Clostridiaceae bacterium]